MSGTTPALGTEVSAAGEYPSKRFNQRERKLLESVKTYVDGQSEPGVLTTQGDIIVGDASGDAARLAKGTSGLPLVAGASTVSYVALSAAGLASDSVTTAKILNANVTLAKLSATAAYTSRVIASGTFTTAGGDANESITATGALATDLAFVQLKAKGVTPRTILTAAANTDAIDVVMSGDPSTDHVICWQIIRVAT